MRHAVSPVFSASAATAAEANLPAWDLSDLYPGPGSAAVTADFAAAEAAATAFEAAHAGKLAELSGAALAAAIGEYERIDEILGRVASYAQLLFAGDSTDAAIGQFYQTVTERVTTISSHLLFFTLELNRLDEAVLDAKLHPRADPGIRPTRRWRAGAPGCATCACSARTSSPTSWKSCCTRRR